MRTKLLSLSVLLAASMLIGGANVAQAQNFNRNRAKTVKNVTSPGVKTAVVPGFTNPDKPSTVTYYISNGEGDSLKIYEIESFEYDENGFVSKYNDATLSDSIFTTDFYKRDENGEIIENLSYYSETGFDNMFGSYKKLFRYDNIVNDLPIFLKKYINVAEDLYSDPVWNIGQIDSLVIVRDSLDRIISSERYGQVNDLLLIETEKCTYGEGIGPEKIEYVKLRGDDSYYNVVNDSIVWKKCANQIHGSDMLNNILDDDGYQLISRIETNDMFGQTLKYVYKYDDADRLIESWIYRIVGDSIGDATVVKVEYLDDNNSYKSFSCYGEDSNGNGIIEDTEIVPGSGYAMVFDDKGREILMEFYNKTSVDGELQLMSQTKYEYIEDDKGRLSEVYSKDFYFGELGLEVKMVYTYDDTATGIASVNREGMDLKVSGNIVSFGDCNGRYVVCNGDGRMVMSGSAADGWVSLENLPSGFYIVSVNGQAVKVLR